MAQEKSGKVVLEIRVPKLSEETPESSAQLFASLGHLPSIPFWKKLFVRPISLSFEIAVVNQVIHFYLVVPENYVSYFESQLSAQYPKVLINKVSDFLPSFLTSPYLALGQLTLTAPFYFPLKTYKDFKEVDPLSGILGVLGKARQDEGMLVQIIIEPTGSGWRAFGEKIIFKGMPDPADPLRTRAHPQAKTIQEKITQNGFKTGIRIMVGSNDSTSSLSLLQNLAGAFGTFSHGEGNALSLRRPSSWQKKKFLKSILERRAAYIPSMQVLNNLELATIWHLPGEALSNLKNIAWGRTLLGEPPENLPVAADLSEADKAKINFIARTEYKNRSATFGIKNFDRRKHIYLIGKTGTGKSTLIANMAINDMRNNEGVAVVDPHGDLSEILLDYVPSFRLNDVCYLDPSDTSHPFHLNPLELTNPEYRELVASGIVSIFYKLYYYSWGPRLEYILRNTLMTLLSVPNTTLVQVPEILSNEDYRRKIVDKLEDPVLKSFWVNEFEKMSPQLRAESISPILNKVGQFVTSPIIRGIIGTPTSTINLEDFMNNGKILIVNLSQGKLGEDNAALLGAMFITKMQLAAMNRVHIKEEERRDFYLYVDEFQSFATSSFIKILSEARKYRLNLCLANQYIGQLSEDLQKAIFGNAGTLVSFLLGAEDSRLMAREFGQTYEEQDLVSLGNYQIVIKIAIDNLTSTPFPATTLPLPRCRNQNREKVLRLSREKYTKQSTPNT